MQGTSLRVQVQGSHLVDVHVTVTHAHSCRKHWRALNRSRLWESPTTHSVRPRMKRHRSHGVAFRIESHPRPR